jgi:hypothetical protein
MSALVENFDSANICNHKVFLKHEENTHMTELYYHQLKKFQWLGPFGSETRLLFHARDKD